MFPLNPESHTRIILVGKAASGKDHLRKRFEEQGFSFACTYTTRPPRKGEKNGEDYFFIDEEKVQRMIDNGNFYEYVIFNGWIYGRTKKQFWEHNLFIMTPGGISQMMEKDRKKSFIIYLDAPMDIRKTRLTNRDMPGDTLQRRIEADEIDFADFTDYDLRVTNADF